MAMLCTVPVLCCRCSQWYCGCWLFTLILSVFSESHSACIILFLTGNRGVEAEERWSPDFLLLKFVSESSFVSLSRVVRSAEQSHLHEPRTVGAWTSFLDLHHGLLFQDWTTDLHFKTGQTFLAGFSVEHVGDKCHYKNCNQTEHRKIGSNAYHALFSPPLSPLSMFSPFPTTMDAFQDTLWTVSKL